MSVTCVVYKESYYRWNMRTLFVTDNPELPTGEDFDDLIGTEGLLRAKTKEFLPEDKDDE